MPICHHLLGWKLDFCCATLSLFCQHQFADTLKFLANIAGTAITWVMSQVPNHSSKGEARKHPAP